MTMHIEITEPVFRRLVDSWIDDVVETEQLELACKYYYRVGGMRVTMIHNYIGDTWQYYILDINS